MTTRLLANQIARADAATPKGGRAAVRVRSARTSQFNLPMEHPWVFARAGLTDWIENPAVGSGVTYEAASDNAGYSGLGAAPANFAQLMKQANKLASDTMPPGVKAAIDASPLTLIQKSRLKREPLTVFVVMAEFSQRLLIDFIRDVEGLPRLAKKQIVSGKTYNVGGRLVKITARKTDDPISLAIQFLTVCNKNPIKAVQVASQYVYTYGIEAPLNMTGAAIGAEFKATAEMVSDVARAAASMSQSAATAAQTAATAAGKSAGQAVQAGQQAAQNVASMVTSMWPFGEYGGLAGDPASGGAAAGAGSAGGAAFFGSMAVRDIVGLVSAAIALANVIVPMLLNVQKGNPATPPTAAQAQAANAAASKIPAPPSDVRARLDADLKILGMPKEIVYAGGAVGLGTALFLALRKKK
jgi:hypothetical protein